jgi:hypothetical protein
MKTFFASAEAQGGQAIVMVAVTMLALLMMVGLAIDAGQLYSARRTMQESADAAAYAGAVVLYQKGTPAEARSAATEDAARNGYTTGGNVTVTTNLPPASGPHSGDVRFVEVIITDRVRTSLVPAQSLFNSVRVRGVGGAEPLNNQYAIMALDRGSKDRALQVRNNGEVHLTGGGILVNSTSSTAADSQLNANGSECKLTITPSPHGIDVAGSTNDQWPVGGCAAPPTSSYSVDTGFPQQADPFAGFQKPQTAGPPPMTTWNAIGGTTVQPGIYTVPLDGPNNSTVTLGSGIYVLKAGLNTSGQADLVSGPGGIFIFNTHSDYPAAYIPGTSTCGPIRLTGNASATDLQPMSAATNATYANFLIYQDPNCTNEMSIRGNGSVTASGTIYLPTASFIMDGNNAVLNGSQLIANSVDIQNGNITIDFSAGNTAQPILPRLTE